MPTMRVQWKSSPSSSSWSSAHSPSCTASIRPGNGSDSRVRPPVPGSGGGRPRDRLPRLGLDLSRDAHHRPVDAAAADVLRAIPLRRDRPLRPHGAGIPAELARMARRRDRRRPLARDRQRRRRLGRDPAQLGACGPDRRGDPAVRRPVRPPGVRPEARDARRDRPDRRIRGRGAPPPAGRDVAPRRRAGAPRDDVRVGRRLALRAGCPAPEEPARLGLDADAVRGRAASGRRLDPR